jgi:hypothetical protein
MRFEKTLAAAKELGFKPAAEPKVHGCHAVVLEK